MKRMLLYILLGLAAVCLGLSAFGYSWLRRYQALAEDQPEVTLVPTHPDLAYCRMDETELRLDLYLPSETASPAWPVLVYAHGGSFTGGDKRQGSGIVDIPAMTARGYAVAAVNYRLMPAHPFPAEIQDVKCAVRFLRAHAGDYQLDTAKIGIWGGSAGGHLAALLGLTNGDPAFEAGEYLDQSSEVAAVVVMFGPTDLTAEMGWLQRSLLRRAFGTASSSSPLLSRASPVAYVTPAAPPFLIFHGDQDSAVPLEQAQILYQKLAEAGPEARLVVVENANHNFKPTGGPIEPERTEISQLLGDYFDRWLK